MGKGGFSSQSSSSHSFLFKTNMQRNANPSTQNSQLVLWLDKTTSKLYATPFVDRFQLTVKAQKPKDKFSTCMMKDAEIIRDSGVGKYDYLVWPFKPEVLLSACLLLRTSHKSNSDAIEWNLKWLFRSCDTEADEPGQSSQLNGEESKSGN